MALPKFKSNEELLAALELEDNSGPAPFKASMANFIAHYDLQPGDSLIAVSALRKLYDHWNKKRGEVVQPGAFAHILYRFFPKKTIENKAYVYLNKPIPEMIEKIEKAKLSRRRPARLGVFNASKTIQKFFDAYGLKDGKLWLTSEVLYYLYRKWSDSIRKWPIRQVVFTRLLKLFFVARIVKAKTVFRVHESILPHIPAEILQNGTRNVSKTKPQKRSKVPSTRSGV